MGDAVATGEDVAAAAAAWADKVAAVAARAVAVARAVALKVVARVGLEAMAMAAAAAAVATASERSDMAEGLGVVAATEVVVSYLAAVDEAAVDMAREAATLKRVVAETAAMAVATP